MTHHVLTIPRPGTGLYSHTITLADPKASDTYSFEFSSEREVVHLDEMDEIARQIAAQYLATTHGAVVRDSPSPRHFGKEGV